MDFKWTYLCVRIINTQFEQSMTWWKCLAVVCVFFIALLGFLTLKCEQGAKNTLEDGGAGEIGVEDVRRVKQHVPKFMLDLYHQNRMGMDLGGPDVVRSVVPKTTGYSTDNTESHFENKHELIFDLPKPNKDEQFVGAELKVLSILEGTNHLELNTFIRTSIFDADDNLIFKDKLHYHRCNTTWLSFNLTHPLLKSQGLRKVKVVIVIKSSVQNGLKLSLLPDHEDFEHDYPVLLLSYTSGQIMNKEKRRKKRSIQEEDYDENRLWDDDAKWIQSRKMKRLRNTCRRRPLYVDFSEIEYDTWIVQPSGYEAYQCQGKCFYPVAEHLSPTKHAIVQALLHSVSPLKASRSCCVPTRLEPISVLYVDANGVLTYRYAYKDMVVVECGCR